MLEKKSMPKFYWVIVVRMTVYIQNWIGEKVSAHELYFGRKPNISHLRVFGSTAYVHVPNEKWKKLEAKAEKCILVGLCNPHGGSQGNGLPAKRKGTTRCQSMEILKAHRIRANPTKP